MEWVYHTLQMKDIAKGKNTGRLNPGIVVTNVRANRNVFVIQRGSNVKHVQRVMYAHFRRLL